MRRLLACALMVAAVACEAPGPAHTFVLTCFGKEHRVIADSFAVRSEGCVTLYNASDHVVFWTCGCSSVIRVPE